ncbi:MAG: restriction endonuclease [Elusimicrobia bacterium]|nr:restriction endonuclease [Elusimicrobiota bacterium]
MPNKSAAEARVDEALQILEAIGFPLSLKTPEMQRRLARILLGVCKLTPKAAWSATAVWEGAGSWCPRSREIIPFVNKHYGEDIKDSSYDDVRRKNLDFLVASGLVLRSPGRPNAATNDSTRGYAVNPAAADLFRLFGAATWKKAQKTFCEAHPRLDDKLLRKRELKKMPVILPEGVSIDLIDGSHNQIQKAIIEEFLPRFVPGAQVLYLGDASQKTVFIKEGRLKELNFFELSHDRLPDLVAYDPKRNWVFLIEAVHSSNPVSHLRHYQLEQLAAKCTAGIVFVSAFQDRKTFAKWVGEISWETEVWLVESPDHMIHFNGDKFLGPHQKRGQ